MRYILLIIFCALGLLASAQWYRIDLKLKKKQYRPPFLEQVTDHSIARVPAATIIKPKIRRLQLDRSEYSIEAAENIVMKMAQHNMRFRIYNEASYNFSDLAQLYIHQNRYSEAKWFLLQSNSISRVENDDRHTISNLISLATIKSEMGDYTQAQQDITEAYNIACSRGFGDNLAEIEKKILDIKQNRLSPPKSDLRYAETPQNNTKAE